MRMEEDEERMEEEELLQEASPTTSDNVLNNAATHLAYFASPSNNSLHTPEEMNTNNNSENSSQSANRTIEKVKVAVFLTTQRALFEPTETPEGIHNLFREFRSTKPYIQHKIILNDIPMDVHTRHIPLQSVLQGCLQIILDSPIEADNPMALRLGQGVNVWYGKRLYATDPDLLAAMGPRSEGILPLVLADEHHLVTRDEREGSVVFVEADGEPTIYAHQYKKNLQWSLLTWKEAPNYVIISLPSAQFYSKSSTKLACINKCKVEAKVLLDLMISGAVAASDWLPSFAKLSSMQLQAHDSFLNRKLVRSFTPGANKLGQAMEEKTLKNEDELYQSTENYTMNTDNLVDLSQEPPLPVVPSFVDGNVQTRSAVSNYHAVAVSTNSSKAYYEEEEVESLKSFGHNRTVVKSRVDHREVVQLLDELLTLPSSLQLPMPEVTPDPHYKLQDNKKEKQPYDPWKSEMAAQLLPLPSPLPLPSFSPTFDKLPSDLRSDMEDLSVDVLYQHPSQQEVSVKPFPQEIATSGKKHPRPLTLDIADINATSRPRLTIHPKIPPSSLVCSLKEGQQYEVVDLSQYNLLEPLECQLLLQQNLLQSSTRNKQDGYNTSKEVARNGGGDLDRVVIARNTLVKALRFSKQQPEKIMCEFPSSNNSGEAVRVKIHFHYFLLEQTPSDMEDFD